MNIQPIICELEAKEAAANTQSDHFENLGDDIRADHWFGIGIAYNGSIQLLKQTGVTDLPAIIQEITERGEAAATNSRRHTDNSSRAHAEGIAKGSQKIAAYLQETHKADNLVRLSDYQNVY